MSSASIMGKPLGSAIAEASAVVGLDAYPIRVEVCATRGPAFFQLVGLAETAVKEARVRVASSLAALGVLIDEHAITINLAPAGVRKSGAALDLAMAIGVLAALDGLPPSALSNTMLIGELSLTGGLRAVTGVLPQLTAARQRGVQRVFLPHENAREAGLVEGLSVFAGATLLEVVEHLCERRALSAVPSTTFTPQSLGASVDLSEVRGQAGARRALEIAAAGQHNLLAIGPPGSGKTLLARALPGLLPPLTFAEAVETTTVHSVAGLVDSQKGIVNQRPFRAPHHSVSEAGLIGGGDVPRPGEISLAHNGVLFLDELAEFRRNTLEALRQPLEDGSVCIVRARARARFPARPLVVAAVNPCPCGYWGHPLRPCRCSAAQRERYLSRLSGPLLDRLDLHVTVPPVAVAALGDAGATESSQVVRARVQRARMLQAERFSRGLTRHTTNATLALDELEGPAMSSLESRKLLGHAVERLGFSARAYVKVLRVARTIADLADATRIGPPHVAEAIQGRMLDPHTLKNETTYPLERH